MADAVLRVRADTTQAERALGNLQTALGGLATLATAKALAGIADAATNLSNKLNQISNSTAQTNLLFNELIAVANNARTPLASTGDLFFRIARSADTLGISQRESLLVTELVSKGISASGISAQEASGPLLQFGQALQSGRFQGDELRSILEGLPVVSRALATSLNVPIGALKSLGSQGKISAKQVIDALLQAQGVIEKDFGRTVITVSGAITILSNNFTAFIARLDQSAGATSGITKAIGYLSDFINFLGDNIGAVATIFNLLLLIPMVRGISLLAKGFTALSYRVTSIGYTFKDITSSVAAFSTNVVKFFKSMVTQISGSSQNIVGVFDAVFRAIFLPLAAILKLVASSLKNFTGPITVAIAYISGLLDTLLAKIKSIYEGTKELLGMAPAFGGRSTGVGGPTAEELAAYEALNKKKAAAAPYDEKYIEFLKELKNSLGARQSEIALLARKGQLTEDEFAFQEELNKLQDKAKAAGFNTKEVQLLNQKVAKLAQEESQLQRLFKEYEKLLENGKELVVEAARGSDARIGISSDYYKKLELLDNYYVTNKSLKDDQYLRARAALEHQFNIDMISAEMQNTEKMYSDKFALDNRLMLQQSQHFNLQLEQEKKLRDLVFENFNQELIKQTELFELQQNSVQRRMDMQFTAANQEILLRTQIYELEVSQQEKLANLRQSMFQKELQQRGFSLEQSKSMATERTNFDKKTEQEKTQFAIEQAASVFASLGQHNRAAFQAAKAFNIASAIMNTYTGATKALATYPPPFNFIAAAGVVAMGLAQVASIRAQTYAGRALGGPMVGGQQYIVGERGPELITAPSGGSNVVPNNELGGSTTIVFQIQANDTRGFDQLLAERKGMIINMVRQAQQDRGRMATV